jgi:hypothetical protein
MQYSASHEYIYNALLIITATSGILKLEIIYKTVSIIAFQNVSAGVANELPHADHFVEWVPNI